MARKQARLSRTVHQRLNMDALAAGAAGVGTLALAQPAAAKILYTSANTKIIREETFMSSKRPALLFVVAVTVALGFTTMLSPLFAASKEKVLYSFCSTSGCPDGNTPYASLIVDGAGSLYGTTSLGGPYGSGTVFELTPGKNGTWTESVLHSFCSAPECSDGAGPYASVIFDASGNLYGTTTSSGDAHDSGTVFELSPGTSGTWAASVLYTFCRTSGCPDGAEAHANVTFDVSGNLYGTTVLGGRYNLGTVFELTPVADSRWTEKVLHSFGKGKDGIAPVAGLIFDGNGNLYGTTNGNVSPQQSIVFELLPSADNKWTQKRLHKYPSGSGPVLVELVFDGAGNLYGTTSFGGTHGSGTVFELTPGTNGTWTQKVLHNFGSGKDGGGPCAGLILDTIGNLYGTTYYGGAHNGGTVFELSPGTNGKWAETILHSFDRDSEDGLNPQDSLIFDRHGNLYGTTPGGGAYGEGTVFQVTP